MASYQGALEAAGARVLAYEEFGSYQGDWFAKVEYDGRTGWINGSFGSCSGCDALQAEFDYDDEPEDTFEAWRSSWRRRGKASSPEQYETAKAAFDERYSAFGRSYLDALLTQEEAEAAAARNIKWDSDAEAMLNFVRTHA